VRRNLLLVWGVWERNKEQGGVEKKKASDKSNRYIRRGISGSSYEECG